MSSNFIYLAVPGIVALVLLAWVIGTYNGLVRLRQHVRESWAGIDTELKRRYDLIPNLVRTVKGYAAHEREVLQRVTEARALAVASTGPPESQARDENALVDSLRHMFAVIERYPDLKASGHFRDLQQELVDTEDRIAAARRFYNGNVRDLNTRIEVVPSNLLATLFGFRTGQFFEIQDASVRAAPRVLM